MNGYRSILMSLVLIGAVSSSLAQLAPPSLRCASVEPTGDVTLSWVPITDNDGVFGEYRVMHATALAGPYAMVGSVGVVGASVFTHIGGALPGGPQFYHVITADDQVVPALSQPSDTISTIFLEVTQSTPLGNAQLDWLPPSVPLIASAGATYGIWQEYPLGTWTQLGTVPNDRGDEAVEISICEDTLNYRISLEDASGCISFSNAAGDWFADATPPSSPVMVTVSVDTSSGQATLTWLPSPEDDTDGYIILLNTPNGNIILDTVYGQFTDSYTWDLSNAGSGPESFTLAAFDTCATGDPPSPNTSPTRPAHTTVHISTQYDRCGRRNQVSWTPYVGWPVQGYELHFNVDGGAWAQLGTFGVGPGSFMHEDLEAGRTYCYVVKAIGASPGEVSLSNKACRVTEYPPLPQFNYLRTVTVLNDELVLVVDSADMAASVRNYRLERSANGGPWQEVAVVPGVLGPRIDLSDDDVQADRTSYMYRVVVSDSCGNEAITSNVGTSILLRAEGRLEGFSRLIWNGYEDWAGQVGGYAVYRSIDGGDFEPVALNDALTWGLDDDVSDLFTTNGRFCYYVEAFEVGNPSGINARARSNVACAIQPEQVWIPNAFILGGINDAFIPVTAYTDMSRYEFTIMNRWGQVIWTTSDPQEPWRGTVDGKVVPQGVYAWYCTFRNGAGRTFEKRGTVTMLVAVE